MPESPTVELSAAGSPAANAALEEMLHALQDALRLALAKRAEAAADPVFWATFARAYHAYDQYIAVVTSIHPMQCRRGCRVCCSDNAYAVAGVELARVARRLRADGRVDEVRPVFASRAAVFRARREALGLTEALATNRAQGRPCPLLGEDGARTIYADRPLACRMFQSLTPPEWCDPQDPRYPDRQNPHLVPPLAIRQIVAAISELLALGPATTLWEGMDEVLSGG